MELRFHKNPVSYLSCQMDAVENKELTQEVRLPDGMPDIGRVLTTWGQVLLRSKERYSGTVTVSGGVMAHVLYIPEDEQEPRVVECWIPFQHKWDVSDTEEDGPIRVYPIIRFADSRGLSARKLMVRIGMGIMLQVYDPVCEEIPSPGTVPEDIQILNETYPLRMIRDVGEKHFHLDEDMIMPDFTEEDKLLCAMVIPEITESNIVGNRIVFRGNGQMRMILRKRDGMVVSHNSKLPFSQYSELPVTFSSDSQSDIVAAVTNLETDVLETGKIRLKCSLVCQYRISDRQMIEVAVDAYSPRRELQLQIERKALPVILDQRQEIIRAEQTIPGLTGSVTDVFFTPDFPRQYRTENGVELEIPAVFQTLSYSEDDVLQASNTRWEGKMNLPANERSRIRTMISSDGSIAQIPGSEGMTIAGNVLMDVTVDTDQEISMISGMDLGEPVQPDPARPSLILCRAADENLWGIAKRTGSTVAQIQERNALSGEPQKGQMLLIPVL